MNKTNISPLDGFSIPKTHMKALVLTGPDAFSIMNVPIVSPGPGEVLCRVMAVTICGTDPKIIRGEMKGLWPPAYPFIIGHEWAGQIVQCGEGVTGFEPGDRVVGEPHKGCGKCRHCLSGQYNLCDNYGKTETGHRHYGFTAQGCYAEYFVCSATTLHNLPDELSYPEGAMVDSAGVALHGLRLAGVAPGSTAVVIGPGAIGLCAIQLVRAMGASRVIAVGRTGARLQMAKNVGADDTVDVLKESPIESVLRLTGGRGADITLDASGNSAAPTYVSKMTRFGGKIILLGFFVPSEVQMPLGDVVFKEQTIFGVRANPNIDDQVIELMKTRRLDVKPLISHIFPLDDFATALNTFIHRAEGAMKVVIEP